MTGRAKAARPRQTGGVGPQPEVAAVRRAVRAALADTAPGGLVLVACSGGADSIALACATAAILSGAPPRTAA